jgi:hypothetical protein
MPPVTLDYDLTRADLDAFATHQAAIAPHLVARIRRMRLVWAVVFTVIVWEYAKISPAGALGFAAVGLAYLAAYGPLNRFLYARQNRRLNRDPEAPRAGHVSLELTTSLRSGAIRRVDRSPAHHFVYIGPTSAIIIPRSGAVRGDPDAFVDGIERTLAGRT